MGRYPSLGETYNFWYRVGFTPKYGGYYVHRAYCKGDLDGLVIDDRTGEIVSYDRTPQQVDSSGS